MLWQIRSQTKRFAGLPPRYASSAAHWHGVPLNMTGRFSHSSRTARKIPRMSLCTYFDTLMRSRPAAVSLTRWTARSFSSKSTPQTAPPRASITSDIAVNAPPEVECMSTSSDLCIAAKQRGSRSAFSSSACFSGHTRPQRPQSTHLPASTAG